MKTDVAVSALETLVARADHFGGVTVMVNNACILDAEPALEVTEAHFDRVMVSM